MYINLDKSEVFAVSLKKQSRLNTLPMDDDNCQRKFENKARITKRDENVPSFTHTTIEEGANTNSKSEKNTRQGSNV